MLFSSVPITQSGARIFAGKRKTNLESGINTYRLPDFPLVAVGLPKAMPAIVI